MWLFSLSHGGAQRDPRVRANARSYTTSLLMALHKFENFKTFRWMWDCIVTRQRRRSHFRIGRAVVIVSSSSFFPFVPPLSNAPLPNGNEAKCRRD